MSGRADASVPSTRAFKAFATSGWRLSRLENGLRIFEQDVDEEREEVSERNDDGTSVDGPEEDGVGTPTATSASDINTPGCKGVGLIFAQPSVIFNLLMDLGASRAQWDLTFERGEIVRRVGKYSDIVRITLRDAFADRGKNQISLRRTWSFDRDGSFAVALASVADLAAGATTQPQKVFGGWLVTPFSSSSVDAPEAGTGEWTSACLVTNATKMQRGGWLEWLRGSAGGASLPVRTVCAQVAGLRELCEHTSDAELNGHGFGSGLNLARHDSGATTLGLDDDECFFEASSQASEDDCAFYDGGASMSAVNRRASLEYGDDLGSLREGCWPAEPGRESRNAWCSPDGNNFRVRDVNYLRDRKKRLAGKPFADLVAVDWFVDYRRVDNVCARPTGTCQRKILSGPRADSRFVFCINIQVPGARHHSIVYYFVLNEPLDRESVFGRFVGGDQEYRDARLKLIPHVALGPWVVQRAVGTKPLIVGKALKVRYHSRPRFLEVDIDIGSSAVANNVVRFVLGYVRTLVVDMCFLVEGKTDKELPERLIGTSRVAHLEPDAAVAPPPEE